MTRAAIGLAAAVALAAALAEPALGELASARTLAPSEIPEAVDRAVHSGLQARLQAGDLPDGEALAALPAPVARLVRGMRAVLDGRLDEADRLLAPLAAGDGGPADVATAMLAELRFERGDFDGLVELIGDAPPIVRALRSGPVERFAPIDAQVPEGGNAVVVGERGHIGLAARAGAWSGTFWFDTGAGLTVLSASLAAELGVEMTGADPIPLSTSTEIESEARIGVLPVLEVGEVRIENHRVAVLPDSALRMVDSERDWGTLHAILGWTALRRMRLTVDVPARRFQAELAGEAIRDAVETQSPNLTWMGYPLLRLTAGDGQRLLFGIDTGSWNTSLTEKGRRTLGLEVARRETVDVTGVGGSRRVDTDFVDGVALVIGGVRYELDDVAVEARSGSDEVTFYRVDGVLGADVLRPSRLTLDFSARRFDLGLPSPYARPEGASDAG